MGLDYLIFLIFFSTGCTTPAGMECVKPEQYVKHFRYLTIIQVVLSRINHVSSKQKYYFMHFRCMIMIIIFVREGAYLNKQSECSCEK